LIQYFFSFPRGAWECLPGRSASCKCQTSSRLSHAIILVAGRGASEPAFPRGAWERDQEYHDIPCGDWADSLVNDWRSYEINIREDGYVEFFIDNEKKWTSTKKVDRTLGELPVVVGDRDTYAPVRIDNIQVNSSEPPSDDSCWAIYENGSLHIPCIKVMGPFGDELHYEADMQYEPLSEPMNFQVTGVKPK